MSEVFFFKAIRNKVISSFKGESLNIFFMNLHFFIWLFSDNKFFLINKNFAHPINILSTEVSYYLLVVFSEFSIYLSLIGRKLYYCEKKFW